MFWFYANLLSANAKYAWNKIVKEQTTSDPYIDLQGISKEGPREPSCKSFDDYVIFHLLTVFPNNATEQEKSYLSNMPKKPQHVDMRQFVQRVEQLIAYIAQLPCWYYSPSVKPNMTPANVPFTKADLASHILWMCLLMWQNQFDLHEKGMTPMDMRSLITSLKAIEHVCTQEKIQRTLRQESYNKSNKGNKRPGTGSRTRVPKIVHFEKHCDLYKKQEGAHTTTAQRGLL